MRRIPGAEDRPTATEWLEASRYGDLAPMPGELEGGVESLVVGAPWAPAGFEVDPDRL